jgi:hypothetical protein
MPIIDFNRLWPLFLERIVLIQAVGLIVAGLVCAAVYVVVLCCDRE